MRGKWQAEQTQNDRLGKSSLLTHGWIQVARQRDEAHAAQHGVKDGAENGDAEREENKG